ILGPQKDDAGDRDELAVIVRDRRLTPSGQARLILPDDNAIIAGDCPAGVVAGPASLLLRVELLRRKELPIQPCVYLDVDVVDLPNEHVGCDRWGPRLFGGIEQAKGLRGDRRQAPVDLFGRAHYHLEALRDDEGVVPSYDASKVVDPGRVRERC